MARVTSSREHHRAKHIRGLKVESPHEERRVRSSLIATTSRHNLNLLVHGPKEESRGTVANPHARALINLSTAWLIEGVATPSH